MVTERNQRILLGISTRMQLGVYGIDSPFSLRSLLCNKFVELVD